MENKNKIYHAVEKTPYRKDELKIFLAGTIDNGDSEDWQTKICRLIEECSTNSKPIAVYNPRRDDWPRFFNAPMASPESQTHSLVMPSNSSVMSSTVSFLETGVWKCTSPLFSSALA